MGFLLDARYVYALAGAPGRLTPAERAFLAAPSAPLHISAVSIWEIRLKWRALHPSGTRPGPLCPSVALKILQTLPITFIPLSPEDAVEILLAQAKRLNHSLVTRDRKLATHPFAHAL